MRYATTHGFKCRWDTKFVDFVQQDDSVLVTLEDKVTRQRYHIRTKYLFGADGARSQIVRQLELPLVEKPIHGWAINVLVEADLSHLMEHRSGNLHWVMQPDSENNEFALLASMRMVKPWNEWIIIMFPKPGTDKPRTVAKDEYLKLARAFIGDPSVPIKLLGISYYDVNEAYAERYSRGNV
jgi:2-polyprenyl-6-methoxyphenol hydroxylase-like FAD-dependent oxidoreductase